jgi:mRNA-degrading endonuclease RelE of RelBE toxin-antitoxin system
MKLVKPHSVEAAIRTLDEEDRERVSTWLTHLANWEDDPQTRRMAKPSVYGDVFVLDTPDDIRIFFKLNDQTKEITVLDIAKPSRFVTAGRGSE